MRRRPRTIGSSVASAGRVQSLAVLPFVNASGDAEIGIPQRRPDRSVILALSTLPHLRVMSRSAVFRQKERSDEPLAAGRALGVETVLTGKVLQRGDTLSISAELMDVEHGWHLWVDSHRRKKRRIS